jgi:hypothetical protein
MNPRTITTMGTFRTFLLWLAQHPARSYPESLATYLCALWRLIQAHADMPPSWALFGQLLLDALTQTPTAFDPAWLSYTAPPALIREHHLPAGNGFAELRHLTLYQIADLQRLSLAGVFTDEQKLLELWLGAGVSPTGHCWSNLYPSTFLGQIPYGLQEHSPRIECSWADLAMLLWIGQIYE